MKYYNPIFPIIFVTIPDNKISANPEKSSHKFDSYDPFINKLKAEIKKTYPDWENETIFTEAVSKQILDRKCKRIRKIIYKPELSDFFNLSNNQNKNRLHVMDSIKKKMLIDVILNNSISNDDEIDEQLINNEEDEDNENLVKYDDIYNSFYTGKVTDLVVEGPDLIPDSESVINGGDRDSIYHFHYYNSHYYLFS